MKFTIIPTTTFENIQLNAGVVLSTFDPDTAAAPTDASILGATSGGVNFKATPTFKDYGEGIDNCPRNMKELKRIDYIDVTMDGNFITIKPDLAKRLAAAADIDSTDNTKIVPRVDLTGEDFSDLWWVGDYGDGGMIAIKILNALSTGGFQIQAKDKDKGTYPFTFTGHFSMQAQNKVPYEIYVAEGE